MVFVLWHVATYFDCNFELVGMLMLKLVQSIFWLYFELSIDFHVCAIYILTLFQSHVKSISSRAAYLVSEHAHRVQKRYGSKDQRINGGGNCGQATIVFFRYIPQHVWKNITKTVYDKRPKCQIERRKRNLKLISPVSRREREIQNNLSSFEKRKRNFSRHFVGNLNFFSVSRRERKF